MYIFITTKSDKTLTLISIMTIQSKTITDANAQEIIQTNKVVLIDCWAPWCRPCQEMSPIIDELAKKFEGKAFIGKLNIDENPTFPVQHNIKSIPTILFFKNGEKVDQLVGNRSKEDLIDRLNEVITQ